MRLCRVLQHANFSFSTPTTSELPQHATESRALAGKEIVMTRLSEKFFFRNRRRREERRDLLVSIRFGNSLEHERVSISENAACLEQKTETNIGISFLILERQTRLNHSLTTGQPTSLQISKGNRAQPKWKILHNYSPTSSTSACKLCSSYKLVQSSPQLCHHETIEY